MSDLTNLVALLEAQDCRSYTLHATDNRFYSSRNPDRIDGNRISLRLTIIGRTHFHQLCQALAVKPVERVVNHGQRAWWAESDTPTRRLLIEGVSFQHHDDWQPRDQPEGLF